MHSRRHHGANRAAYRPMVTDPRRPVSVEVRRDEAKAPHAEMSKGHRGASAYSPPGGEHRGCSVTAAATWMDTAPAFDGRDVESYHRAMVEYNSIMRELEQQPEFAKNYHRYEKASRAYSRSILDHKKILEVHATRRLQSLGGWGLRGIPLFPSAPPTRRDYARLVPKAETIFSLSPLITREAAAQLIKRSEEVGYRQIVSKLLPSDRNNTRCIVVDEGLASQLFKALAPHLPRTMGQRHWKLYGVNPRFRMCRYHAHEAFAAHLDDRHRSSDATLASFFTLVIYLNDDFDGGEFNFVRYKWHKGTTREDRARDLAMGHKSGNITCQIKPKLGTALIFEQSKLHEGSPIHRGTKYLLRTDIVYVKKGTGGARRSWD